MLSTEQQLLKIFSGSLGIDADAITDNLKYNDIPEWDSMGHMALVTDLETAFDIMLDTDDIIDMSSFGLVKEILKKYGVSFEG
jgi:acyl carrier protein